MSVARFDAELPLLPKVIGLSDRAFRLYVSCACYSSRWSIDTLHINHARAFVGIKARVFVNQLVAAELSEWVDTDEFRLIGEGDIWRSEAAKIPRRAIPDRIRQSVYERDEYACVECAATEALSLDHIYPHSLGGSDGPENLQTLFRSCNSKKGARV